MSRLTKRCASILAAVVFACTADAASLRDIRCAGSGCPAALASVLGDGSVPADLGVGHASPRVVASTRQLRSNGLHAGVTARASTATVVEHGPHLSQPTAVSLTSRPVSPHSNRGPPRRFLL